MQAYIGSTPQTGNVSMNNTEYIATRMARSDALLAEIAENGPKIIANIGASLSRYEARIAAIQAERDKGFADFDAKVGALCRKYAEADVFDAERAECEREFNADVRADR